MAEKGNLGDLHVTLRADSAQFERGMASAAATAEAAGTRIETSLKKQATAFTSVIGRVFSVIAVFRTFLEIGKAVGDMLESSSTKAEKFINSLDSTNARGELDALQKRIDELSGQIGLGLVANLINEQRTESQILSEREQLEQRARSIRNQLAQQKRLEAAKKETAELRKQLDLLKQIQDQQSGRFSLYDVVFAVNANTEILRDIASRIRR